MALRDFFLRLGNRQYVRPWALAAPVVVLMIALPLLRPLRHPTEVSAQEAARLAAVQSLVEYGKLVPEAANLPPGFEVTTPVFTVLVAGPYWVLHRMGYGLAPPDTALVTYLLTLVAVTMPAAAVPGLIYRVARVFELKRPWRSGLALAIALSSGLITYATVLNPHAPAAFCVMASVAALVHVSVAPRPQRTGASLMVAGLLAATAAVIDVSALPFLLLLPVAILAFRWSRSLKVGGVLLFAFGALPPLLLHVVLTTDLVAGRPSLPETVKPLLDADRPAAVAAATPMEKSLIAPWEEGENWGTEESVFAGAGRAIGRVMEALMGEHGLLSHFPVFVLAFAGIGAVVHRHWPAALKAMAVVSAVGAGIVIVFCAVTGPSSPGLMYATRFFVPFSPLLLFWSAAWVRKSHHPATWVAAGVLVAFSAAVGIVGAMNPYPPGGYSGYTPVAAIETMVHPPTAVAGSE
jgi:hypothetical protein